MDVLCLDVVDPDFAEALWRSALEWLLRTVSVDGLVPCGLNDVIRIQKFVQGGHVAKHTDRSIKRDTGAISKYSLRIFLNSGLGDSQEFEGGWSVFHVPFQSEPVVFRPEAGFALLYPQGELCTLQEETEVTYGTKYVLRADVLFRPEAAVWQQGQTGRS